MIVTGSYALMRRGHGRRSIADIDVIGTEFDRRQLQASGFTPVAGRAFRLPNAVIVDFELATPGSSGAMYENYCWSIQALKEFVPKLGCVAYIAPIEVLFSLKRSHRHSPRAWRKHIEDYDYLKHRLGHDRLDAITKVREAEVAAKKTPNLHQTAADFFKDDVSNHVFLHDEIHAVMAHRERPMFEYIQKDQWHVTSSRQKFDALSHEDKLRCVLEEAYVIALERAIIPMLWEGKKRADPTHALQWALMRICTTLTSGWFRDFATENWAECAAYANPKYHEFFLKAVDEDRIRRIGY